MRLGKVKFWIEYVVDLDNEDMVDHAVQAVMDDLHSMSNRSDMFYDILSIVEDGSLKEEDIPSFLIDNVE